MPHGTVPTKMPPLDLVITGATSRRATSIQEYVWYGEVKTEIPPSSGTPFPYFLDGPLDRSALERSLVALIERNSAFRTTFREVDGKLHQVVLPLAEVPQFELELVDCSHVAESERDRELKSHTAELFAKGFDPIGGRLIRGRLIVFAPERHLLVLAIHRLVMDLHTGTTLPRELFKLYNRLLTNVPLGDPPPQYIDYTDAMARWVETPDGKAQDEYWKAQLRGVAPVVLPLDSPRDEVDAARDAAPLGIKSLKTNPIHVVPMAASLVEHVGELAAQQNTTARLVFLASYVWLLHSYTGQREICLEVTYTPWHYQVLDMLGPTERWTVMRVEIPAGATFGELIRRVTTSVHLAERGIISDYYGMVPHTIRRATFQEYGVAPPIFAGMEVAPGLHAISPIMRAEGPASSRYWTKPWDLHLSVHQIPGASMIRWGAAERLFRPETIEAMSQRYIDLLTKATVETPITPT